MGFDYEDQAARWRGDWPLSAEASDRLGAWREMSSMVGDAEARDAVGQLMKRFEFTAQQGAAMVDVLAKRSSQEYARLLEAAEGALKTVIQPISDGDQVSSKVYAALDDPHADWSKVVVAMLNRGPIESTGEQAIKRFKFVQSLEERFDAEMKDRNKNDDGEEPGIGKRG